MRTLHSFPILASLMALPKDMSRALPTELTRRLRTENPPWHTAKTTTDKTESTTIKAIAKATITVTTTTHGGRNNYREGRDSDRDRNRNEYRDRNYDRRDNDRDRERDNRSAGDKVRDYKKDLCLNNLAHVLGVLKHIPCRFGKSCNKFYVDKIKDLKNKKFYPQFVKEAKTILSSNAFAGDSKKSFRVAMPDELKNH